ncbi:MAG: PilZ domain-containing protein [Bdellovibrionota bacterium]
MSKKVFTSQKISIFLAGTEVRVQALVSTYGAKYVFDEEDLPEEARAAMGLEVQASYKGIPVRCRFVRETNPAGTIFSLRFLGPSSLLVRQIEKDVATAGLPSPWMRGLPRLATSAKHLPVPVLAVVNVASATFYMNVKNFTVGGLLLEYSGADMEALQIGTRLEFDLVTNGGDKLPDIVAVITHVSSEPNDQNADSARYQFGLKFLEMTGATEMRYRGMIREHCVGLREELAP